MPPGGWGFVMMAVGLFFVISATVRSRFFLYRLFVARSETMMGEHAHRFLQFAGVMIMVAGLLMLLGVF
ncbi:hypothetical protein Mal4_56630 [Maioricimonas rarisocia]|uniref:Uncharacterized protein n=1 Tax=Maioricimonas rarisocia TaxID=2528026 RepID=A0A517ZFN5_9PLAN|nr:hypothetical protein [Maioricimonas rarisocia]QDU41297.1 hypothetical protein Mal4_56630 [Maioricimonas rarisocia]